jgi:dTDP-4-dehydrorhamnose 3,5-epimerase
VDIDRLPIEGSFVVTPRQFADARGVFLEFFRSDTFLGAAGHSLSLAQANCSVSAKGVMRGIHFASVPPGQAKYVTCLHGSILDVTVDIRLGSPTFGQWHSVQLDTETRRAVYLTEGLGHVFLSLQDDSTVMYLCSEGYAPGREFGIDPFDPDIGISWPDMDITLSDKDRQAPSLAEVRELGLLPDYQRCMDFVQTLA